MGTHVKSLSRICCPPFQTVMTNKRGIVKSEKQDIGPEYLCQISCLTYVFPCSFCERKVCHFKTDYTFAKTRKSTNGINEFEEEKTLSVKLF